MKVKTSEAKEQVLGYLVAKCEGYFDIDMASVRDGVVNVFYFPAWQPSTDWALAGPIIERERISIEDCQDGAGLYWEATRIEPPAVSEARGPTPLVAAMRAYVASKLGDEVEVPDELA